MLFWEAVKIAFVNLTRRKLRTVLTMLGIIFGVAAVLSMLSIGAGAEQEALSVIQKMGLRNIIVQAKDFEAEELKILRQDSPGLSRRDMEHLGRALPEGTLLVGKRQLKSYQIVSESGKSDSSVWGVGALFPHVASLRLVEGAFFLPIDERQASQVCVLGTTARRKLFGVNSAVGEQVKINGEWFTVIGVLADQTIEQEEFEGVKVSNPNNEIYLPLQTLLSKYELDPVEDELDEVIVRIPDGVDLREQAVLISSMVGSMHRQIDDFSLVVPEQLLAQQRQTQRIFNIVMGAIASISLLVGGIGIMNIMLASVLERTSEIGLRRALGARQRDVSRQFVMEAVAISLAGALLGISLGYGISEAVAAYSGWPTIVTPVSIILGVGVSSTVGLVFGIYPARQASRISPIEALRYE
ncbi:MAG TPA: ABC transporter permease [Acidobacteriota bacterium]|nr:ABC transporter permease [Acidobacteriota bacterium]